jgi:hypothetical protein
MHYISYIEAENPVVLAVGFEAQGGASSNFVSLFALQIIDFFIRLE